LLCFVPGFVYGSFTYRDKKLSVSLCVFRAANQQQTLAQARLWTPSPADDASLR
jgi:hypothetical protein